MPINEWALCNCTPTMSAVAVAVLVVTLHLGFLLGCISALTGAICHQEKPSKARCFLQAEAAGSSRRWLCWGGGELNQQYLVLSSHLWGMELSSAWQRRKISVGGLCMAQYTFL